MSHQNGISILDQALSLAVNDLTKRGMSVEDAHIALVVRLKHLVSPEIFQVADLLSEDEDVSSILSQNPADKKFEAAEV
ncbi:MAG: hypothetical protein VX054_01655 [Pseudomonadota bacterium]|nr:hypothetical protein [Pseudomonadota bacterium]